MSALVSHEVRPERGSSESGFVSDRIRQWLSGKESDIVRRSRRQVAQKAGAFVGLAAMIADVIEAEKRPCHLAVAKPLTLQPAFFTALASELHYLTETDIAIYFSGPQGQARSWRWAHPRAIRNRLQSFVKGPVKGNQLPDDAAAMIIQEYVPEGSNETDPIDILLYSRRGEVDRKSPRLARTRFVELVPLI